MLTAVPYLETRPSGSNPPSEHEGGTGGTTAPKVQQDNHEESRKSASDQESRARRRRNAEGEDGESNSGVNDRPRFKIKDKRNKRIAPRGGTRDGDEEATLQLQTVKKQLDALRTEVKLLRESKATHGSVPPSSDEQSSRAGESSRYTSSSQHAFPRY